MRWIIPIVIVLGGCATQSDVSALRDSWRTQERAISGIRSDQRRMVEQMDEIVAAQTPVIPKAEDRVAVALERIAVSTEQTAHTHTQRLANEQERTSMFADIWAWFQSNWLPLVIGAGAVGGGGAGLWKVAHRKPEEAEA